MHSAVAAQKDSLPGGHKNGIRWLYDILKRNHCNKERKSRARKLEGLEGAQLLADCKKSSTGQYVMDLTSANLLLWLKA